MLILYTLYNRDKQRVNILPTYTINGIPVLLVYSGLINAEGYNYWIKYYLLPYCNPYPALRLVVVIDNISFYHLGQIRSLFTKRGIVLIYLPIYSPNLNPIKEFFSKLNKYI